MASKIPIKVTTRVTTRVQRQVRVQHQTRTRGTGHVSFAAWQGPMPEHTTNYYGDTNTITARATRSPSACTAASPRSAGRHRSIPTSSPPPPCSCSTCSTSS